jgi:ELWxxDGT repeat protein
MKKFIPYFLGLFTIFLSITCSAIEQKKVFEVDSNRELTRTESIAPSFYQKNGPYLFFLSQPSEVVDYDKVLPAYSMNAIWRLDTRDNSLLLVVDDIFSGQNVSYGITNERIIYYSRKGLMSVNLSGSDKKVLSPLQSGLWSHLEPSLNRMRGRQMLSYNGYVYFPVAGNHHEGPTLWRTNGTGIGTSKVDLCIEDLCYFSAQQMLVSNNKLFFLASRNNGNEHRVWSVDNSHELAVIPSTGTAYTKLSRNAYGIQFNTINELWFSDGTSDGTYVIAQEEASGSLGFNETIVISTATNISFIEGKGKGTTKTVDLGFNTIHTGLIELNDSIFFVSNRKLMRVDKMTDEPQEIFSFPDATSARFKMIKGKGNKILVFRDNSARNNPKSDIWVSDGTTLGTSKLTDHGVPKKFWDSEAWLLLNNDFYFSGFTESHGVELWRSDGTPEGTLLAKDIGYGQTKVQAGPVASNGQNFYYAMQKKWYGNVDGIIREHTEQELWKTDASTMRSSKVTQWQYPEQRLAQIITVDHGQFWWRDDESQPDYYYDLDFLDEQSGEVITVITDMLGQCGNHNFTSLKMQTLGNKYFFQAPVVKGDSWSCQLWVSDGTVEGSIPLTDFPDTSIHPEKIENITVFQNEVYFSLTVNVDEHIPLRTAIFKSDGTIEGTKEVFRLAENGEDSNAYIGNMLASSEGIFIVTSYYKNNESKTNLWYWQPTGIKKIIDSVNNFHQQSLVRFKQGISFININAIWRSDGTDEGTYPFITLPFSQHHYPILHSTPDSEQIIYNASIDTKSYDLWASDGTTIGTRVIAPGLDYSHYIINEFIGDDVYLTYWTEPVNNNLIEHLIRYSLIENEPELLRVRSASSIYSRPTILKAQGRAFIGQHSDQYLSHGTGFGGPYVTARLDNDDIDNDGVMNINDAFPLHSDEQIDTDGDDIGNNLDTDDDNDMIADELDLYPLNATEWADEDGDGVGNIADTDDDNDGVTDWLDSYPRDSSRSNNAVASNSDDVVTGSSKSEKSSGGVIHYYIICILLLIRQRKHFH